MCAAFAMAMDFAPRYTCAPGGPHVSEPRSPKEARRMERLKHGSRSVRDVRPRAAPRQRAHRPAPVLGSIQAGTSDEPTVMLSKRAVDRLAAGRVWVYPPGV